MDGIQFFFSISFSGVDKKSKTKRKRSKDDFHSNETFGVFQHFFMRQINSIMFLSIKFLFT